MGELYEDMWSHVLIVFTNQTSKVAATKQAPYTLSLYLDGRHDMTVHFHVPLQPNSYPFYLGEPLPPAC